MSKQVFGIEGLDRLGKSTLIQGILDKLGYYQVIHFSKPQKLQAYENSAWVSGVPAGQEQVYHYQHESFLNSMLLAVSGARIIFDRWHIGEAVYSPMYRGYSGDYVYDLERRLNIDYVPRLILLTEDFKTAKHFVDDGNSLGPVEKREREQELFIAAFERSRICDKRIICVTDTQFGGFRPKQSILEEALK
jgi:thymidylate kinase